MPNLNKINTATATGYTFGTYWMRAIVTFVVALVVYKGGMLLLDVHLEYFSGLDSFNFSWIIAMSIFPVAVGVLIGFMYGFGGKYLAHFPPAVVMLWDYQSASASVAELPASVHLLPWGMWVMFVILQMEFCAAGGFIGEIIIRKRRSWDNGMIRTADSEPLPEDDAEVGGGPQA